MRLRVIASLLLLIAAVPAAAQLSISINIGSYPNFMVVPGYPVYYAPDVGANFFFYDGLYWVYQNDNWYASSWYNGPWDAIDPIYVPIYVLQIPVRYYRQPPQYFSGWQSDRPPRWNDHWGRDWAERRSDWDRPQSGAYPTPAPLPDYQRRYSGKDYPRAEQQRSLQQENYHYHSQNTAARPESEQQADARRSRSAQPNIKEQPARDNRDVKRDWPRRTPKQVQQPRPAPQPTQQHTPSVPEAAAAGAQAAASKPAHQARGPEQKRQSGRPENAGKSEDKGDKSDKGDQNH